jgi:hypothetical protein
VNASCLIGAGVKDDCTMIHGKTSEGPYRIEMHDNDLLIMEGYDDGAMERARQVLFFQMTPAADTKGQKSK